MFIYALHACNKCTLFLPIEYAVKSHNSCRGLSSNLEFSLKARCTPCSLYLLDFVLNSCGVFPTTEAYPLVFIYMQGVFFAFHMSVGLCPQTMWCTPHYRGLSSCFSFMCL